MRTTALSLAVLSVLPIAVEAQTFSFDQAAAQRPTPHQVVPDFLGWVPDEIVVVMQPQAVRDLEVTQVPGLGPVTNVPILQAVLQSTRATDFRPQFARAATPELAAQYKVRFDASLDLDAVIEAYSLVPGVERVEPIGIHSLYQTPNDTYYQGGTASFPYDQWHYYNNASVDADIAWNTTTGDPNVLVGILDSGTRYFHVDLGGNVPQWGPSNPYTGGNIFVNPGEVPGNGQDDDGNGYTDDTIGWDFVTSAGGGGFSCIDDDCGGADNDPDDTDGHGTHVAGTVGAITNNGILVAGVAGGFSDASGVGNGVSLVPMRIGYHARYKGQTTGIVRMDWAAEAMVYLGDLVAAGHNVASINCSWGSSNSGGIDAAVNYLQGQDTLIVAAAGNSGSSSANYLGAKAGVMNVAATDINGNGASFSNYGSWVDLAAPGVDILSTIRASDDPDPTAHYISLLSGTSMAAPHAAGVAALLRSCDPTLSRSQMFSLMVNNTTPYNSNRDLGSGIVNAALALAATNCNSTPCTVTAGFSASATAGCDSLTVSFTDQSSNATGWSWNFGDGNTSTAQNPTHTYSTPGTYSVTLQASDANCSDTTIQSGLITVSASPGAAFDVGPTSGTTPLTVSFSDQSSGTPTNWTWNFGDGNTSTAQNPSHTYTTAGTYDVSLTVSNACGNDATTAVGAVTVTDPGPATTMSVGGLSIVTVGEGKGFKHAEATITIVDNNGDPVQGATVTGNFTGKTSDPGVSGTTGANGQVTLSSSSAKGGGGWCFAVTNVTGSLTYSSSGTPTVCN